jgi:hypothetical protein
MRHTKLRLRACYNVSQVLCMPSTKLSAPFQGLSEFVRLAVYFKDFDCLVGRTCCQAATVVVKGSIMLESPPCQLSTRGGLGILAHTIMSSWPELDMTCACERLFTSYSRQTTSWAFPLGALPW